MEETVLQLGRARVASFCQVQKAAFISSGRTLGGTDSIKGALAPSYLGSARLQVASAPRFNLWNIAACPDPNNIGQVHKAPFIFLCGTLSGTDSLRGASPPFYQGSAPQFKLKKIALSSRGSSGGSFSERYPCPGIPGSNNVDPAKNQPKTQDVNAAKNHPKTKSLNAANNQDAKNQPKTQDVNAEKNHSKTKDLNAANNHDGDKYVTIRKCDICFVEENEKQNIWLRTRCSCDGDHLVRERHRLIERALHQEKQTYRCNTCHEVIEYIPVTLTKSR